MRDRNLVVIICQAVNKFVYFYAASPIGEF